MSYPRLALTAVTLLTWILTGCTALPSYPIPQIDLGELTSEEMEVDREIVKQDNCKGTAELSYEVSGSRQVSFELSTGGQFEVNADGQIGLFGTDVGLGAAVAANVGVTYGTTQVIAKTIKVGAAPGTYVLHVISHRILWKTGTATVGVNGLTEEVQFRFPKDFSLVSISVDQLPCPGMEEANAGSDNGATVPSQSVSLAAAIEALRTQCTSSCHRAFGGAARTNHHDNCNPDQYPTQRPTSTPTEPTGTPTSTGPRPVRRPALLCPQRRTRFWPHRPWSRALFQPGRRLPTSMPAQLTNSAVRFRRRSPSTRYRSRCFKVGICSGARTMILCTLSMTGRLAEGNRSKGPGIVALTTASAGTGAGRLSDEPDPDGIGLTPPPNLYEPVRGFGWLWRTHLGRENGPLGWALDKAYGFDDAAQAQAFEGGVMFRGSDPKLYILLDNGEFYAIR